MRFPVGLGTKEDFEKNWYNADDWDSWRDTYYHGGADINLRTGSNTDCGQPIYPISKGEVTHVETTGSGFGKHLHIKHEGDWGTVWTHYAHCNDIFVNIGDVVTESTKIATIGTSGNSKYCHLHFEVKIKPAGVRGVANSKAELLEHWTDPLAFIYKWLKPMSENTQCDELLKYYNVKTIEELKKMVDTELNFLKNERDKSTKLSQTISELEEEISDTKIELEDTKKTYKDKLEAANMAILAKERDVNYLIEQLESENYVIGRDENGLLTSYKETLQEEPTNTEQIPNIFSALKDFILKLFNQRKI